jgi:hypothetical protein
MEKKRREKKEGKKKSWLQVNCVGENKTLSDHHDWTLHFTNPSLYTPYTHPR